MSKIIPVVLSGGAGSRLWPLSREGLPKQFLPLFGKDSLFVQTLKRVSDASIFADPIIICNDDHRFLAEEHARSVFGGGASLILEPVGKNTAPAAAVAALHAAMLDADAILLVLPSDHIIQDKLAFLHACQTARQAAAEGWICCFGVEPAAPETGYGYIQRGKPIPGLGDALRVAKFTEKPDMSQAQSYLDGGQYLWNSGIFMMQAGSYLAELEAARPQMLSRAKAALEQATQDLNFCRLDAASFAAIDADSIDYAVMEQTKKAAVIPVDFGWSDLGAFSAVWQQGEKTAAGNVIDGEAVSIDSKNCYIHAGDQLVAALGVEDLVIVATDDAVLVADKQQDQQVKALVEQLRASGREEIRSHKTVYRPWGSYRSIAMGGRYQVKEIMVKPGKRMSLQLHHHRAEHWVVVEGTATVTRGDDEILLTEDQSIYLPVGTRHRLLNPGKTPLTLIEVQTGGYLGEDDILRFDDDFGRQD